MSWINSRPKGWTQNLNSEEVQGQFKWQRPIIKYMREQFFPGDWYGGCYISRGVPPVEVAKDGAIIMWRKRKTGGKPIIQYRHTTHFNLKHWNASLWSIIYFHSPIEGSGTQGSDRHADDGNVSTAPASAGPPSVPGAPKVPPPLPPVPKDPTIKAPPKPSASKPNIGAGPTPAKVPAKLANVLAKTPPVFNKLTDETRDALTRWALAQGQNLVD